MHAKLYPSGEDCGRRFRTRERAQRVRSIKDMAYEAHSIDYAISQRAQFPKVLVFPYRC